MPTDLDAILAHPNAGRIKLRWRTARLSVIDQRHCRAQRSAANILCLQIAVGPTGMSLELRNQITGDIRSVVDKAIEDRLTATGQITNIGGPEEFAKSIDEQRAKIAEFAKDMNAKFYRSSFMARCPRILPSCVCVRSPSDPNINRQRAGRADGGPLLTPLQNG